MSEYMRGRQDGYRDCKETLDIIEGLPDAIQLKILRGWVEGLIERPLTVEAEAA